MRETDGIRTCQDGRPHFAYGSNMWPPWLWLDAPSARARGLPAKLADSRLAFSKLSTDGSTKANLILARRGEVWGVLFDIESSELGNLNRKERGYEPTSVTVLDMSGELIEAWTYVAGGGRSRSLPYRWYLDLIERGALHFQLPGTYRKVLARQRTKRSPADGRAKTAAIPLLANPNHLRA